MSTWRRVCAKTQISNESLSRTFHKPTCYKPPFLKLSLHKPNSFIIVFKPGPTPVRKIFAQIPPRGGGLARKWPFGRCPKTRLEKNQTQTVLKGVRLALKTALKPTGVIVIPPIYTEKASGKPTDS